MGRGAACRTPADRPAAAVRSRPAFAPSSRINARLGGEANAGRQGGGCRSPVAPEWLILLMVPWGDMPGAAYLEGDGVVLRTIEEDDLPFLRDAIDDPRVRRYLPSRLPLNLDDEREFYEEVVVGDDSTANLLVWARTDEGGEVRAGTIGVHGLGSVSGEAEVGLFLVPDHWGRSLGTEAARLVVDWAFRERRMHRVIAHVVDGNEASARIWESLGFTREATLRDAAFREGTHVNMHLYGVLEDEWPPDRGG